MSPRHSPDPPPVFPLTGIQIKRGKQHCPSGIRGPDSWLPLRGDQRPGLASPPKPLGGLRWGPDPSPLGEVVSAQPGAESGGSPAGPPSGRSRGGPPPNGNTTCLGLDTVSSASNPKQRLRPWLSNVGPVRPPLDCIPTKASRSPALKRAEPEAERSYADVGSEPRDPPPCGGVPGSRHHPEEHDESVPPITVWGLEADTDVCLL